MKMIVNYGSSQLLKDLSYYCNKQLFIKQQSAFFLSHKKDTVCGICCAFLTQIDF